MCSPAKEKREWAEGEGGVRPFWWGLPHKREFIDLLPNGVPDRHWVFSGAVKGPEVLRISARSSSVCGRVEGGRMGQAATLLGD